MSGINRQWKLAKPVTGMIGPEHFEKVSAPMPKVGDGEVLFKNIYLSFDPAQRTWLTKGSYMGQVTPGMVMKAQSIMQVVESKNSKWKVGDLATGVGGWQDYVLMTKEKDPNLQIRSLSMLPQGVSPTLVLSLFGTTGLTAYFGLLDIGKMKKGDIVLVSGAAGATGSIVGQIAKIKGASKVIGIAGGKAKCDYLKEIGFDEVVDYRDTSSSLISKMRKACPKGVDVYFDNVGGETLEAALLLMRKRGRIALCGGISQYNPKGAADVQGPKTYLNLIGTSSSMEGFLVFQFARRYPEGLQQLAKWYQQGLLKQKEDVRTGFDNIPKTLQGLYTSSNFGKMLLKMHDLDTKNAKL
eukprot:TRINITY_DN1772_c3_g2_i1.p1 TRINITY_DN1772_c3_g2~~TRINITY_DN1772_c3_g2_i1.p1  ORF type:complete len:369 (+),score=100.51 TRINITY_DN1772_c3_g2_i1:48-1109(+)